MKLMQMKLTIQQNIKQTKYSHIICQRFQATLASWKPILRILAEIWRNKQRRLFNTEQVTHMLKWPAPGPLRNQIMRASSVDLSGSLM